MAQQQSGKQKKERSRATGRKQTPYYLIFMPLIMFFWGMYAIQAGELIAVDNGCGWDGSFYADLVFKNDYYLHGKVLDSYRVQRIIPSTIIHYALKVFQMPPVIPNTVYMFSLYHVWLLALCGLLWAMLARRLNYTVTGRWLGFALLFLNFAIAKYAYYYPPLTDPSAFFLGLWALYCYMADTSLSRYTLLGISALGFFTWPTAAYISIVLFLFPRSGGSMETESGLQNIPLPRLQKIMMIGASTLVIIGLLMFTFINRVTFPGTDPLTEMFIYPGAALLIMVVCFTAYHTAVILPAMIGFGFIRQKDWWIRFGITVLCLGTLWTIKNNLQNPDAPAPMNAALFVGGSFTAAVSKPLLGIIAGVVYYGPVIILAMVLLPQILKICTELGTAFLWVFTISITLCGLMTESRQWINLLPFIVLAVIQTLERYALHKFFVAALLFIGIGFSKLWMSLNFEGMHDYVYQGGSRFTFPLQRYFMNQGPYMSMESYLYQLVAVVLCGIVLWWFFRQSRIISPPSPKS